MNTSDIGGGAERAAWMLFEDYERRGIDSWLLVGDKKGNHPKVLPFFLSPHIDYRPYAGSWQRFWLRATKAICREMGFEDFEFPYSRLIPGITGSPPDIIHFHNLHGGYFDLRVLAELSARIPVFLTLQDNWMLTGHCAMSQACARWLTGCGRCPDLARVPAVRRDATRLNWWRKSLIYRHCRLHVAAPSMWLLDQARRSMLGAAIVESRVIPNGYDHTIFNSQSRLGARARVPVPMEGYLLVAAANGGAENSLRDWPTLENALSILSREELPAPIHVAVIGGANRTESLKNITIHHLPFMDQQTLADYFRAADIFVHATRADSFGMVNMEAMACGAPVVTSSVGGIPEVVKNGQTGLLTELGNPSMLAAAVKKLLLDPALRIRLGTRAAEDVAGRFDRLRQAEEYAGWFTDVLERWRPEGAI